MRNWSPESLEGVGLSSLPPASVRMLCCLLSKMDQSEMGCNFPSGFPFFKERWRKGGKGGRREKSRLMCRKGRHVRENVGRRILGSQLSFYLRKKEGV